MIAHTIGNGLCMERQREFYHKCHRCIFRGKPVDFVPPESAPTARTEPAPIQIDVEVRTQA